MTDTLRKVDEDLDRKLTSKATVESIAAALRAAAFEFDQDDLMTIAGAADLEVEDADDYRRGYQLLSELGQLDARITQHYTRFDRPLLDLTKVVRNLKNPQLAQVAPVKQQLSRRLGLWKAESDRRDRERAQVLQDAADTAARNAQAAKAETLRRIADQEANPMLKDAFKTEAEQVAAVDVRAAPVELQPTAPAVSGGSMRTTWHCRVDDVRELMRAFVEGRCHLPEDDIIEGLQSFLDKQTSTWQSSIGKAYPGCAGVPTYTAIKRS